MMSPPRVVVPLLVACLSLPLVAFAPSRARADPGARASAPPAAIEPTPPPARRKSPGTGLALSLGGSVLSWTAFLAGLSSDNAVLFFAGVAGIGLAPQAGHVYVEGESGFLTAGLAVRAAGAAGVTLATALELDCLLGQLDDADRRGCGAAEVMFYGGLAALGVGTIMDIVSAPIVAHRHNRNLRLELRPTVVPAVDGAAPGIGLTGRF
jgi:hypothetical protein